MAHLNEAIYSRVPTDHPDFQETMIFRINGAKTPKVRNTKPIQNKLNLNVEERQYFTVKEIPQIPKFSWLTESALRHLIDRSKTVRGSRGYEVKGNGFAPCVMRIEGKILIDAWELEKWVESHRMSA